MIKSEINSTGGSTQRPAARWNLAWCHLATFGAAFALFSSAMSTASGQVVQFSRLTDTILLPGYTSLSSHYTLEAFVLRENRPSIEGRIWSEQSDSHEDKQFKAASGFTDGLGYSLGCFENVHAEVSVPISTDAWHHVAFVVDGNLASLYIDGQLVNSRTTPCTTSSWFLGVGMSFGALKYPQGAVYDSFQGYVDWIRVSSVARYSGSSFVPPCEPVTDAATQILAKFNELAGSTTILVEGSQVSQGYLGNGFNDATSPQLGVIPPIPLPNFGPSPSHPQSSTTCPSGTATFSITASGTAPFTYQWRKGGVAINSSAGAGGNPSAATATLTLMNVQLSDSDVYDCIVTNSCGSVTSNPATLTICIGDFNCDGGVDGADVEAFFDVWSRGSAEADVNQDGGVDGDDVGVFFERWGAGC